MIQIVLMRAPEDVREITRAVVGSTLQKEEETLSFFLELCELSDDEEMFFLTLIFFISFVFSLLRLSTMPPRRGRAADSAAAATDSAANLFDETHNNENAPLASGKQATTTAAAATQNGQNTALGFSTPKLALRTFSRRKPAAEVSERGFF